MSDDYAAREDPQFTPDQLRYLRMFHDEPTFTLHQTPPGAKAGGVMECSACGAVVVALIGYDEEPIETDAMRLHRDWHVKLNVRSGFGGF